MKTVVIIGVGCAGISAAKSLLKSKTEFNLIILEASDRVGGRCCSIDVEGTPVDIGACWVEGHINNPLTDLSKKLNFTLSSGRRGMNETYDYNGEKIDYETRSKISDYYGYTLNNMEPQKVDISIGDYLKNLGLKKMNEKEQRFFNLLLSSIEQYEGADLSELSLNSYGTCEDLGGGDKYVMEGYGNLIKEYSKGLKISFGEIVKKVEMNKDEIKVTCENGKEYTGDYCICTASLGVLKSGKIEFSPKLKEKEKIIEKLGMGLMNKIILKFKKPFWNNGTNVILYSGQEKGEFRFILNLNCYIENSNILVCFLTCEFAKKMEKLKDEEILELFTSKLKSIYGKSYTDPISHHITRWGSNPFTLGSYSFMKTGCTIDDFVEMGKPIENRLFFAGEHTTEYYSHLHSAFISGERCAKTIIDEELKKK